MIISEAPLACPCPLLGGNQNWIQNFKPLVNESGLKNIYSFPCQLHHTIPRQSGICCFVLVFCQMILQLFIIFISHLTAFLTLFILVWIIHLHLLKYYLLTFFLVSDNFSHTYKSVYLASWATILVFYSIFCNLVILYLADVSSLASFLLCIDSS